MEELYADAAKSTKLRLVVVERRDDLTSRQVIRFLYLFLFSNQNSLFKVNARFFEISF